MCFSAEASFAAGAVLLPAGVYCVRVAIRRSLRFLPLALVPIFFGLQQISEGFVWLGLARGDTALVELASLLYLGFALGFWPFWVPFSIRFLENRPGVRRWLSVVTCLGLTLGGSLYLPMALNFGEWLDVRQVHHSIIYNPHDLPVFDLVSHEFWDLAYGVCVLSPFFIASLDRRFSVFRALLTLSAAVSLIVFRHAFVSVWCFFAALLSAQLCFTFSRIDKPCDAALRIT